MRTIHKFEVPLTDRFKIDMDPFGQILSVQMQNGNPQMWVILDDEMQKRERVFMLVGTGHQIPNRQLQYIGTFQAQSGMIVMHLFEDITDQPSLTEMLFLATGTPMPAA